MTVQQLINLLMSMNPRAEVQFASNDGMMSGLTDQDISEVYKPQDAAITAVHIQQNIMLNQGQGNLEHQRSNVNENAQCGLNSTSSVKSTGSAKQARIVLEKGGEIFLELYADTAPITVANFEKLANADFYNGLAFQRVIPGFVAQGGCPDGNGRGSTEPIRCETDGNPHKHVRGALSMAHFGRNTGSCQFFIAYDEFPYLDEWHTVFGQVIAGMEVVDKLQRGDKIKDIKVFDSSII